MNLKTPEQLAQSQRRSRKNGVVPSSEFPIEGSGASSIEGSSASPIEGSPSASLEGESTDLAHADTWPGGKLQGEPLVPAAGSDPSSQDRPTQPIISPAADSTRPRRAKSTPPPAKANRKSDEAPRGEGHNNHSDPEKLRLVAEVNAVWRRLEEEEDKRQRLGEEVEELHLALSEEQRARGVAARDKRAAEQREAEAVREARQAKADQAALRAELQTLHHELAAQRRQMMAKGAATAGGLFGIALVVGTAIHKSATRHRGLFH